MLVTQHHGSAGLATRRPWPEIDALLSTRSRMIEWIEHQIARGENKRVELRVAGRYGMAAEYKAEIRVFEDTRRAFVKIIDGELANTAGSSGSARG